MMYLEDFAESIETLPQDMKHYYSHMRSLDMKGTNAYAEVHTKFKKLCAVASDPLSPMTQAQLDAAYADVTKDFQTAFDQADEKIQLADQTYDIMDRSIRRLDMELKKFRTDLEAKQPGLTAQLSAQSLELDASAAAEEEKEKPKRQLGRPPGRLPSAARMPEYSQPPMEEVAAIPQASPLPTAYTMAPQHVAVTLSPPQQMREQRAYVESAASAAAVPMAITTPIVTAVEGPPAVVDPNEPRYCYCNEVSFGDMVGCDNDDCESGEWFHYKCVGLTEEPNGTWYCFECRLKMEGKG
eukprot:m.417156 g.417156  ORF g.417156 m.417156 type:complete len:297 (-) comp30308_c0_seq1:400-1290(-)